MIEIGINKDAVTELGLQLREVYKLPRNGEGLIHLLIDYMLKKKICRYIQEGATVKGLTIQNCTFTDQGDRYKAAI